MTVLTEAELTARVANTLDLLCLVQAHRVAESPQPCFEHHSRIGFRRADGGTGTVVLSATSGFLRQIATRLLQCGPSDADLASAGRSALDELANITGGEVVFLLGAEDDLFELGLPAAIDEVVEVGADGEAMRVVLSTGQGELAVAVSIDGELACIAHADGRGPRA